MKKFFLMIFMTTSFAAFAINDENSSFEYDERDVETEATLGDSFGAIVSLAYGDRIINAMSKLHSKGFNCPRYISFGKAHCRGNLDQGAIRRGRIICEKKESRIVKRIHVTVEGYCYQEREIYQPTFHPYRVKRVW